MKRILFLLFLPVALLAQQSVLIEQISKQAESFGGRIGVSAKNISTGETIQILGDSLFPTASTIKIQRENSNRTTQ